MGQTIRIVPRRGNTLLKLSPAPTDGSQTSFGPLAAGQGVTIERGSFVDGAQIQVDVWDADDYAAAQAAASPPGSLP